jgi:hypothetical protein
MGQIVDISELSAPSAAAPAPSAGSRTIVDSKELSDVPLEGSKPEFAIKESPLGILDRANFGWQKTPRAQEAMLKEHFGPSNVAFTNNQFVVKKDDNWYQVDPEFQWNLSGKNALAGAAAGLAVGGGAGALLGAAGGALSTTFSKQNLKDLPGDIAQFAGQYGLKTAAATAAAGLTGGTSLIGSAVAAGLGSMGADAAETGVRALGAGRPESLPQNGDELAKQLMGSFIFGAGQEVGGAALGKLGKGTAKFLDKSLEAMGATPLGKQYAAKLLSTISGRPEAETRVIAEDPKAMSSWMERARLDQVNNTSTLDTTKRSMVEDAFNGLQQAKRTKFGQQYDAVDSIAQKLDYAPSEATSTVLDKLAQAGYTKNGRVVTDAGDTIQRNIEAPEKKAIGYILNQANKVVTRLSDEKPIQYDEMKNLIGGIDTILSKDRGVADSYLKSILVDYRANLKNHLTSVLDEKSPQAAKMFTDLNAKYGPAKNMLEELASYKGPDRADAFIKKVVKQDGSFDSELLTSLSSTLGTPDLTDNILRAHIAQQFAKSGVWGGKKIMGIPVGSPSAAMGLAQAGASIKGDVGQAAQMVPYLSKGIDFLKQIGPANSKRLMQNEQLLNSFTQSISSGIVGEKQTESQLMQYANGVANGGQQQ